MAVMSDCEIPRNSASLAAIRQPNAMPLTDTRATTNLCDRMNALTDLVTQFSIKTDILVIAGDRTTSIVGNAN